MEIVVSALEEALAESERVLGGVASPERTEARNEMVRDYYRQLITNQAVVTNAAYATPSIQSFLHELQEAQNRRQQTNNLNLEVPSSLDRDEPEWMYLAQ